MLYVSRGRPRTLSLIFLIVVSRVRSFRYRLSLLYSMTVTIVECVCVRCNCVWRWRTDHTVWRVLAQLGGLRGSRRNGRWGQGADGRRDARNGD